jgi:hypothetical protein
MEFGISLEEEKAIAYLARRGRSTFIPLLLLQQHPVVSFAVKFVPNSFWRSRPQLSSSCRETN